ncbi:hypothetical protein [Brachybacterium sp. GPGPB12]|uniref:hypothetical protein n=1 Tax=Brachybacterium sp. GPGPB12 TaxID=3023517 RepID=UPI0031342594
MVDEAQEHSPMSWRALMRRAPTKSFTVVGDVAQTSSAGGTDSWTAALSPYIQDRLQVEHLTVNYRTPRRIMDRAVAMAQAHSLPVTEVSSVRDGEEDPLFEQASPAELTARAPRRCAACTIASRDGSPSSPRPSASTISPPRSTPSSPCRR